MTTDKTDQQAGATELPEEDLDQAQGAAMTLRAGTARTPALEEADAAILETRFRGNMTDP